MFKYIIIFMCLLPCPIIYLFLEYLFLLWSFFHSPICLFVDLHLTFLIKLSCYLCSFLILLPFINLICTWEYLVFCSVKPYNLFFHLGTFFVSFFFKKICILIQLYLEKWAEFLFPWSISSYWIFSPWRIRDLFIFQSSIKFLSLRT